MESVGISIIKLSQEAGGLVIASVINEEKVNIPAFLRKLPKRSNRET
jgi:hypothetical protein